MTDRLITQQIMKALITPLLLILVALCLFMSGCAEDEWEGFVYPNASDLTQHQNLGVFRSLPECRYAAGYRLTELEATETGTYECGLNCGFKEDWGDLRICEETRE